MVLAGGDYINKVRQHDHLPYRLHVQLETVAGSHPQLNLTPSGNGHIPFDYRIIIHV